MVLYFAYGSNLDREQLERRCLDARVISAGYLPDHRLAFTLFDDGWEGGVADVIPQQGENVWGVIYELTPDSLSRLDEYEDYYEDGPSVYTRARHTVVTAKGERESAWVYSVVDREADFVPPAERYLNILKRAAVEYHFPESYRRFLEGIRTATR